MVVPADVGESLRARHADRHRSRGDDQANDERHGGNQFDAENAASRYSFRGNGRRKTDLPGQLSHDLQSFANQFVALPAKWRGTLSKLLRNKGDSAFLVNAWLTPEAAEAIKYRCAFQDTFPGRSAAR